jgi:hypothetical protein
MGLEEAFTVVVAPRSCVIAAGCDDVEHAVSDCHR